MGPIPAASEVPEPVAPHGFVDLVRCGRAEVVRLVRQVIDVRVIHHEEPARGVHDGNVAHIGGRHVRRIGLRRWPEPGCLAVSAGKRLSSEGRQGAKGCGATGARLERKSKGDALIERANHECCLTEARTAVHRYLLRIDDGRVLLEHIDDAAHAPGPGDERPRLALEVWVGVEVLSRAEVSRGFSGDRVVVVTQGRHAFAIQHVGIEAVEPADDDHRRVRRRAITGERDRTAKGRLSSGVVDLDGVRRVANGATDGATDRAWRRRFRPQNSLLHLHYELSTPAAPFGHVLHLGSVPPGEGIRQRARRSPVGASRCRRGTVRAGVLLARYGRTTAARASSETATTGNRTAHSPGIATSCGVVGSAHRSIGAACRRVGSAG
jgi:hypothetical protein